MKKTKELKPNAKRQFCYTCGSQLEATLTDTVYDNNTGEPHYSWDYKCKNNEGLSFLRKHRIWYPIPDYF